LECERLRTSLKRTDTKINAAGNRISRGEFYDSLTDLRELKKDLEKTREQLQAQLHYWEEMVSKLNRHKSALEETKRIANSLRNDAEDMERSRNEVARAEAEARASGSAVDSHKAASIRQ
jgi:chromosome segregation ATPase